MSIKGYRILSLEANTIYEQEQSNGVDIGYKMPEKKNYAYFCLFNNVLDYSLDLIELEKCYEKKYRKKFYFEDKYKNKYTLAVCKAIGVRPSLLYCLRRVMLLRSRIAAGCKSSLSLILAYT